MNTERKLNADSYSDAKDVAFFSASYYKDDINDEICQECGTVLDSDGVCQRCGFGY